MRVCQSLSESQVMRADVHDVGFDKTLGLMLQYRSDSNAGGF